MFPQLSILLIPKVCPRCNGGCLPWQDQSFKLANQIRTSICPFCFDGKGALHP